MVLCLILLWTNPYSLDHKIEGTVAMVILWAGLSFSVRNAVVTAIRVLSNVVSSLQEDDFSLRAPQAVPGDALGDLAIEINNLARALETERLGTLDVETLLRKVLAEVEAAIFTLAPDNRVKLLNRAAASFVGAAEERLVDRTAEELGITDLLVGPASETISRFSGGIEKRWIVRRTTFRQQGIPHRLILLSEASEALRAEERLAWQRLVRVLSHEINNSLAPIKSAARTLGRIMSNFKLPEDSRHTVELGLNIISTRAEALNRFLQSYARLAKLPPPVRRPVDLKALMERVAGLENRLPIFLGPGPQLEVDVDPDQLEQVLINLIKNGVDAVLARSDKYSEPAVHLEWTAAGKDLVIRILDKGIGLLDDSNLFVPFYTTKETGSGIGLVLSRQIIEAHGGRLMIRNRQDTTGCEVEIKIPECVLLNAERAASANAAEAQPGAAMPHSLR